MDSDNKRMLYAATDSHQSTVHQFGPLFYVAAPVTDFTRWIAVTDMANAFPLCLDRTSVWFDQIDPQRGSQGLAYYIGAWQKR